MKTEWLEWKNPTFGVDVSVEVTHRNAYAYVWVDGKITGDVWLFNVSATPEQPEWTSPDLLPFSNPKAFCIDADFTADFNPTKDIACDLISNRDTDTFHHAEILICGKLHAVLAEGRKPGYCRLAKQDGPLALRLDHVVSETGMWIACW